jgi:ankyrin repeat protein
MKREKMVGTFSGTLTEALFNRLLDDDVSLIQFVDSYGQNLLHLLSKNQLNVLDVSTEDVITKLSPFFYILDVLNYENRTVFELAIENENWMLVTMIFRLYKSKKGRGTKHFFQSMTFALHNLAIRDLNKVKHIGYYLDFVDKLLNVNNLNRKDSLGRRPLDLSIIFRNDMFIKVFLSKVIKKDINFRRVRGFGALLVYAIYFKKEDVLFMLIQTNPSIINTKCLLHMDFYRPEFFRFLLDEYYQVIDFSKKDKNGRSVDAFFQNSERYDLNNILKNFKRN